MALPGAIGGLFAVPFILFSMLGGNLADRVRIGAVIDFVDPPFWPAFNLADAAIVAGVALLVLVLSTPET